ncbi:hypothetical protein VCHA54P496_170107 [Vibrio chagasii]|nr:hypothetical protein VCHA54P495_170107 [Vibrio chagasii]CAH7021109.1 hypothetical protein VCHA54P496_170107 [Vibrio chagasii]
MHHFGRGGHSSDLILSVKHLFGINPYFLKVEANHRLKLVALLTFFAEALWRLPCQ